MDFSVAARIRYNPAVSSVLMPTHPNVLTTLAGEIESHLAARIDQFVMAEHLTAAVRYAALGGGKRLRPALVLLSCEAVGGRRSDALDSAAAIELIHTFSLVHDDLPAMDDDDVRRGRSTLHKHTSEAMAILAGDVMVSLAFGLIAESELSADIRCLVARDLSQATNAMIEGQVYDTVGGLPHNATPAQCLEFIHQHKTGALIRAACRMGAICGGADNKQLESLTNYGEAMGLMFQIVDDLLDVTQSAEHIGKATGKDTDAGKLTFPGLLGIEFSRKEVARMHEEALAAIAGLGPAAQPLRDVCDSMAVRTK
jgi:geranylgeranyl diphosphate synthase type II